MRRGADPRAPPLDHHWIVTNVLTLAHPIYGKPDSAIQEFCDCRIRNPGLSNKEYSSRIPESHYRIGSRIQVPLTKNRNPVPGNPESIAWNPECKTILDSLTRGGLVIDSCPMVPFYRCYIIDAFSP